MYHLLFQRFVISGLLTLGTSVIGNKTVVARLLIDIQKKWFWCRLKGFIWISSKMLHHKNHSAFRHLPYTRHPRIKMTINAIGVVMGNPGGAPFSYRLFHLVANHTSAIRIMFLGELK